MSASALRRLVVLEEPPGIFTTEPLLNGQVRLPILDALFGEAAVRRAPVLQFDRALDSFRVAVPHETVPESSQHGASIAPFCRSDSEPPNGFELVRTA